MHQSPINIDTEINYDEKHVIRNNDSFVQKYGYVQYSDAISHNNGTSVQFDLEDKNQEFSTSATKKWFPEEDFIFKPA